VKTCLLFALLSAIRATIILEFYGYFFYLTLWRPLLPYGCRYKASCVRPC